MSKDERFDLPDYNGGALDLTASSGLLSLDWARDIAHEPGTVPVLTAGALVSSDSELPPDHLVRTSSIHQAVRHERSHRCPSLYRLSHRSQGAKDYVIHWEPTRQCLTTWHSRHALKRPLSVLQFSTLLHTGLLHDMLCLYNSERRQFHTLVTLGANVCGHPRITHGGKPPLTVM